MKLSFSILLSVVIPSVFIYLAINQTREQFSLLEIIFFWITFYLAINSLIILHFFPDFRTKLYDNFLLRIISVIILSVLWFPSVQFVAVVLAGYPFLDKPPQGGPLIFLFLLIPIIFLLVLYNYQITKKINRQIEYSESPQENTDQTAIRPTLWLIFAPWTIGLDKFYHSNFSLKTKIIIFSFYIVIFVSLLIALPFIFFYLREY